ncbi:MAG: sigma-54-dependent Fis family transcriptional regulator, partial [bacterium]|nr:sigma-54-dependent Fis family transcriptional regulator [bacterium]
TTIKDRYKFGEIIGKSQVMQEIYELVASASASDAHVTISGESGTGKELIAHTIHQLSERCKQAFVPVNCGAIPESLFESEFFGYRKGAFTGADRNKAGLFDQAHHGTLFLDEVGELSPLLQVKLLRAIDCGEYMPLGSNTAKKVDVRIVTATNRNLEEQVEKKLMREDFFYRIQVISIEVPSLRERKEDIPLLIDHVLKQYNTGGDHPALPGKIAEVLYTYDWPGNIRQLQNVLQRYLTVKRLDFLGPGSTMPAEVDDSEVMQQSLTLQDAIETFEKQFLMKTLERHHWQKAKAATTLGIERRTLYRKIKKFGLDEQ